MSIGLLVLRVVEGERNHTINALRRYELGDIFRSHKQLHRYLYGGWKLASELRLKLCGDCFLVGPNLNNTTL